MASSTAAAAISTDDVVYDFGSILRVYKSGRLERPLTFPPVPPGVDEATGVVSKDVEVSPFSARLYLPPAATAPGAGKLPVLIYIHGGGFVAESAASPVYHRFLNRLAAACPAVAVSVEYRLAPEHPLPTGYEDALAAFKWVLSAADPWVAEHGDLTRVFLAGDSAGGNICHNVAVHPDNRGAPLRGVMLLHPWFWGTEAVGEEPRDPAHRIHGGRLWLYACPGAESWDDPRLNPLVPEAPGLESLQCDRVFVCAAEADFLRWRGKAYAEAAAKAKGGANVEFLETEGEGHVFFLSKPESDKAKVLVDKMVAFFNGW